MMKSKNQMEQMDEFNQLIRNHLLHHRYTEAFPFAEKNLQFVGQVSGNEPIVLIPCYLLLAECHLGMVNFKQAEEFLSLAHWNLVKYVAPQNLLKSRLNRLYGKLFALQGRYQDALEQIGQDIYCCSKELGPEHIETSGGYCLLGHVFEKMNREEHSLAMYNKVVDIWHKHLIKITSDSKVTLVEDDAKYIEAQEMIGCVLDNRVKTLGNQHIATGEVHYTMGLLLQLLNKPKESIAFVKIAFEIYCISLGDLHVSTKEVETLLRKLEQTIAK